MCSQTIWNLISTNPFCSLCLCASAPLRCGNWLHLLQNSGSHFGSLKTFGLTALNNNFVVFLYILENMKAWKASAMSGLSYSHSQTWMIQTSCGIMRCFLVLLCSNFPEKQSVFWRMVGTGIFFSLHWWLNQIDAFTVVQCRSFSPEESCSLI